MSKVFFTLFLTIYGGCVKTAYLSLDDIATSESEFFSTCRESEGSAGISFYDGSVFVFDIEADWVAEASGNWRMELSDRLGRSVGFMTYFFKENVLATSGAFPERLPRIETDPSGFLRIGDRFVGIQARDFPCHFSGRLPSRWQSKVVEIEKKGSVKELVVDDSPASVWLQMFGGSALQQRYCFETSWAGFLIFFRQNVQVCRLKGVNPITEIKYGKSMLRLTEIN